MKPFDVFFKERNPDKCQVCFGEGQIFCRGMFVDKIRLPCTFCKGTGYSNAPLFTDDEEVSPDE